VVAERPPHAERRVGEMLKELARTDPEDRNPAGGAGTSSDDATKLPSPYARALADMGVSCQTAHRYQRLAEVPKATYEKALDPLSPGTADRG
jgi:hypothetical protein